MGKPSSRDRKLIARLDALYATLPTVACKGRCAYACGAIPLTDLEARRLQGATHVRPRTLPMINGGERCVHLDERDRCSAYQVRPLICRLWGVVSTLSCPAGCEPTRWLNDLEFLQIAQEVERIGGGRVLRTGPNGLGHAPDESFSRIGFNVRQHKPMAEIEANGVRVRGLRAIFGGRILGAFRNDDGK